MKKIHVSELPIIGWREWIALPELEITAIKVKVDTGARTSSLHAVNIRYFKKGEKSIVKFNVHPIQKDSHTTIACSAEVIDKRKIKSSNGQVDIRPIIKTPISLMDETYDVEVSLSSRDEMGFRMLLGREAIRNRFNVTTGQSFLDKRLIPKKKKIVARKRRVATKNKKREKDKKFKKEN